MQHTFDAIAGDAPLLLVAVVAFVAFAIVGSYIVGKASDALWRSVGWLDIRATDKHGRAYDFERDNRRAHRLAWLAFALDTASGRHLARAMYWRLYAWRARHSVRRRIDKLR